MKFSLRVPIFFLSNVFAISISSFVSTTKKHSPVDRPCSLVTNCVCRILQPKNFCFYLFIQKKNNRKTSFLFYLEENFVHHFELNSMVNHEDVQ